MRWPLGIVVASLAFAVSARGDTPALSQPAVDALTAIDSSPTNADLGRVLVQPSLASLTAIADGSSSIDPGVQLRAIHALTQFIDTESDKATAHATLTGLLATARYQRATTGTDVLILRAAIEALGTVGHGGDPADVDVVAPFLDHQSRDVRTAAARALRDLGFSQAIAPLRVRYGQESVPQVRFAISEALRVLPQL